MKLSKKELQKIIQEEIQNVLYEGPGGLHGQYGSDFGSRGFGVGGNLGVRNKVKSGGNTSSPATRNRAAWPHEPKKSINYTLKPFRHRRNMDEKYTWDIIQLQAMLWALGYESELGSAGVDGIFGKNTKKAIQDYADNAGADRVPHGRGTPNDEDLYRGVVTPRGWKIMFNNVMHCCKGNFLAKYKSALNKIVGPTSNRP